MQTNAVNLRKGSEESCSGPKHHPWMAGSHHILAPPNEGWNQPDIPCINWIIRVVWRCCKDRKSMNTHWTNYSDMFRLFLLTSRRYRRVWLSQLWQTCRKNPRSFTNLLSPAFCSFSHKSHSKPSVSSESISKSFGTSFSWKISTTFAGVTNPGFSRQRNPKYQSKHNI